MIRKFKKWLLNSHWFAEEKWGEDTQIFPYYVGPFSSSVEIHSFEKGLYYGIVPGYDKIPESKFDFDSEDFDFELYKEPHYGKMGFVFGLKSRWVFVVTVLTLLYLLRVV